jgi:hypothetical protein
LPVAGVGNGGFEGTEVRREAGAGVLVGSGGVGIANGEGAESGMGWLANGDARTAPKGEGGASEGGVGAEKGEPDSGTASNGEEGGFPTVGKNSGVAGSSKKGAGGIVLAGVCEGSLRGGRTVEPGERGADSALNGEGDELGVSGWKRFWKGDAGGV